VNIQPIKTEADYNLALKRLEIIFDADLNTSEGDEFELLVTLIENYENLHYPIGMPGKV